MDSHNILRVALKLTGLFLIISSCVETAQFVPLVTYATTTELIEIDILAELIAFLTPVVIGAILWLAPGAISNTIIQRGNGAIESAALIDQAERIAIGVLGLFFLYIALSNFVATLLEYKYYSSIGIDSLPKNYSLEFKVIGFQTFLSICLILGSNGLQNFIHKIRYAS